VLIVQDPFTSFYEADVVSDLVRLVEKLGKKPMLLPFKPNGKAQHIKGFLKKFAKTAANTSEFLNQVADLSIPMVGVDPALVLCYRDEYNEILGDKRGDFTVLTAHEWLLDEIQDLPAKDNVDTDAWYLFAHCTEKTKLPNAEAEWGRIFAHFGGKLEAVPVGCCGMAGTYGHESDKLENSKGIYGLSWKPQLESLPKSRCMATGYSCRSQVKRFEHKKLFHPVQVLLRMA
ncbi:(Fe-S)-binding protein, partial [Enterovibrio makurazakiensis]|uniref:(Fe-S)-binding protein n=1 Tax=Enterovibrio makurazakiensis TaxID=2910232 RepID=UPI003D1B2992